MEYAVDGHDVDPSELNDGSWTLALDMQKKVQTPDRDCFKPDQRSDYADKVPPTKDKTAATWKSESKECNRVDYRSRSDFFPLLRGRSESRGDRSQSRPRGDRSSESRGDRSTSRPREDRSTSRPRGDRSRSSHKQATSTGSKPAQQPRAKKSPQDSQIQRDILDPGPIRATRTILGLDVSKAFDNVSHAAILANLAQMNV
ncbi:hypothetical protein MTO96_044948, partial [Rhipicephalus appendiculatus]